MSSLKMASASSVKRCLISSTSRIFSDLARTMTPRIRSTAQNKFTAVGRVASITLHMNLKSNSRSATEVPTD